MAPLFPLLSFDPSSTKLGWALLGPGPSYLASGVAFVPKCTTFERVCYVGRKVTEIIRTYQPGSILIEVPDFIAPKAKEHVVRYFRAAGAAELAVGLSGLPAFVLDASADNNRERKQNGMALFREVARKHPADDDESDAFKNGWDFIKSLSPPPTIPDMPL